jgi:hypothetical protein
VLLIWAIVILYFVPIRPLPTVKRDIGYGPDMWIVPAPLPNPTTMPPAQKTFTYFGYSFDSPGA